MKDQKNKSIFADRNMMNRALRDSVLKLSPKVQVKNPVMFMVFVSAILTLALFVLALAGIRDAHPGYILAISIILWFTVPVRQLCGSHSGGQRQGSGRRPSGGPAGT